MKLKRHVNTECQVRMSLASLQGDVVLPWPLTTAVSVPARDWKEAPGLIVLICSEPGSRLSAVISHFKCERSRAAVTARCYRDSWLRPPGTQCSRGGRQRGEVAPPQTPPHHSPQMTVYPEMINGEASHDLFVLCNRMEQAVKHSFEDKVIWNDEPGELWALSFNSFDRDLTCFRLLNLNLFTDRFATHQNVTNILGLLRKPGPQQRLQLPQTSGLHAGKQDSTNRWSSLFSHFPYGSIWQLPYSTSSL